MRARFEPNSPFTHALSLREFALILAILSLLLLANLYHKYEVYKGMKRPSLQTFYIQRQYQKPNPRYKGQTTLEAGDFKLAKQERIKAKLAPKKHIKKHVKKRIKKSVKKQRTKTRYAKKRAGHKRRAKHKAGSSFRYKGARIEPSFYTVFKLTDSNHNTLYTTSYKDLKPLQGRYIQSYGMLGRSCSMLEFMHACFYQSFSIELLPEGYSEPSMLALASSLIKGVVSSLGAGIKGLVLPPSIPHMPTKPAEMANPPTPYPTKAPSLHTLRMYLSSAIAASHKDSTIASLYNALFLALPPDRGIYEAARGLGIAHLLAISGFHLGVIFGFLYLIFYLLLASMHRYYVPYLNLSRAIVLLCLCVLLFYLALINYQPSFLRAFILSTLGFILLFMGIDILSFASLFIVAYACVALFPSLIFSIGFTLSLLGVFSIYLLLRYLPPLHFIASLSILSQLSRSASARSKPLLSSPYLRWVDRIFSTTVYVLLFNLFIYALMFIPSMFYFHEFTPYQLLGILLSPLFVIFFPLVFLLHLCGVGGLFDLALLPLFNSSFYMVDLVGPHIYLARGVFILYLVLLLLAIYKRAAFYASLILSLLAFMAAMSCYIYVSL